MTPLDAVLAFAVVAGLLTLVPGLDTALVLRSSLTRSRPYAWATAAGIATGAMAWGIAAAVGVSALLTASELAYRVLTTAGAVYMCWLGVSMIPRSIREGAVSFPSADTGEVAEGSPWRGYLVGTGTNLLNPKVGVFYIATIPQFLPDGVAPLPMGAALAGVHGLLTLAWFALLITAGSFARRRLMNPRTLTMIDRGTGLVLIGFGAKLLWDALLSGPSAAAMALSPTRSPTLA
ncbi:LysE family translocator [Dietzia sp. NPDC055340]